jgi:hypothetical protein
MGMSIFDIDDLGFFNFHGLGLRHVGLERGLREVQYGSDRGDAVSLAAYGRDEENPDLSFDEGTCQRFQKKVEQFILQSYQHYHTPDEQYRDAVFMLLLRGDDARNPYDYLFYPLGKCGTSQFSEKQVFAFVKSDSFESEDITHAVYHTVMWLKNICRQLKLQQAEQYLSFLRALNNPRTVNTKTKLEALLTTVIQHYQAQIFLSKPFFKEIIQICEKLKTPQTIDDNDPAIIKALTQLESWMGQINIHDKKGEESIEVIYRACNFDGLNAQELSQSLLHFTKNQNLKNVRECLKHLSASGFDPTSLTFQHALQIAAAGANVEILQAIYEFNPLAYDLLLSAPEEVPTAIFEAARAARLPNLLYLTSQRTIVPRDMMASVLGVMTRGPREHILTELAFEKDANSLEVMRYCVEQGVGAGNEGTDSRTNPLALCIYSEPHITAQKLKLLLPLANARSKYFALLSTTNELSLYYEEGADGQRHLDLSNRWIKQLLVTRRAIFDSLSDDECDSIYRMFNSNDPAERGYTQTLKEALVDDLKFEINSNLHSPLATKIRRCFIENHAHTVTSAPLIPETKTQASADPGNSLPPEESKPKISKRQHDLIDQLDRYINKIKEGCSGVEKDSEVAQFKSKKIPFRMPFWEDRQAANRKANFILALKLKEELEATTEERLIPKIFDTSCLRAFRYSHGSSWTFWRTTGIYSKTLSPIIRNGASFRSG